MINTFTVRFIRHTSRYKNYTYVLRSFFLDLFIYLFSIVKNISRPKYEAQAIRKSGRDPPVEDCIKILMTTR